MIHRLVGQRRDQGRDDALQPLPDVPPLRGIIHQPPGQIEERPCGPTAQRRRRTDPIEEGDERGVERKLVVGDVHALVATEAIGLRLVGRGVGRAEDGERSDGGVGQRTARAERFEPNPGPGFLAHQPPAARPELGEHRGERASHVGHG